MDRIQHHPVHPINPLNRVLTKGCGIFLLAKPQKPQKTPHFLSLIRIRRFGQDLPYLYLAVARKQAEDFY